MTDIAKQLRKAAALSLNEYGEADRYVEAAEEIEKLRELLSSIRHELDNVPWSPDTIQEIAQMMHANGFKFREPR